MTAACVPTGPALLEDPFEEDLVCTEVLPVTHDVATFVLTSPRGRLFGFRPGQYLTVSVDASGVPLERCYTISSAPTRPESIAITVKRTPGGPMSNWLHDTSRSAHPSGTPARWVTSPWTPTPRRDTCSCRRGAGSRR